MNKEKTAIFLIVIFIAAVLFFAAWYSQYTPEYYVKYDGEYYKVLGAVTYEENVQEIVGEIKRVAPRTFWNRDGDTNFTFAGARIAVTSDGKYGVERISYSADTGEPRSEFWAMIPNK